MEVPVAEPPDTPLGSLRFALGSAVALAGVALLFVQEMRHSEAAPAAVLAGIGLSLLAVLSASISNVMQLSVGMKARPVAAMLMQRAGVDRLDALHTAIDAVRRGGTISLVGVYGGQTDPLPMMTLFDKQVTLRMGQANVRRWSDDILPLLGDDDPLGTEQFATHHLSLDDAPRAYADFQAKADGTVKVVFRP